MLLASQLYVCSPCGGSRTTTTILAGANAARLAHLAAPNWRWRKFNSNSAASAAPVCEQTKDSRQNICGIDLNLFASEDLQNGAAPHMLCLCHWSRCARVWLVCGCEVKGARGSGQCAAQSASSNWPKNGSNRSLPAAVGTTSGARVSKYCNNKQTIVVVDSQSSSSSPSSYLLVVVALSVGGQT